VAQAAEMGEPAAQAAAALELRGISASYGRNLAVRDVSLTVPAAGIVALLGPNGAGKTTLLRVASGLLRPSAGHVLLMGSDETKSAPSERVKRGLCLIPEGRGIFRSLTVAEILLLYAPPWSREDHLSDAIDAFPVLGERLKQTAGSLSGGSSRCSLSPGSAWPGRASCCFTRYRWASRLLPSTGSSRPSSCSRPAASLVVEQYVNRAFEMCNCVNSRRRQPARRRRDESVDDGAEQVGRTAVNDQLVRTGVKERGQALAALLGARVCLLGLGCMVFNRSFGRQRR
jgi:branched-chain amino acid transport system ATP-binding protein